MKRYFTQVRRFVSKNVSIPVMAALVLIGGIAGAKGINARQTAPNYFNDGGTISSPNWSPLTLSKGTAPGTYQCASSSNVCTARFNSAPTAHQAPPTGYDVGTYAEN